MATTVQNIFSKSPWRITVAVAGTPSSSLSDYVLTRLDNAPVITSVSYIISKGSNTVDLALSQALLPDTIYGLSYQSGTVQPVVYRSPLDLSTVPAQGDEDPEGEAFGVDTDWLADSLTASGDTPAVHGQQCLIYDLGAIALTRKGELYHRPDDGADLSTQVNGPSIPQVISDLKGRLKRQWLKDDRVTANGVSISVEVSSVGQVSVNSIVKTVALEDPLTVKLPSGNS